MALTQAELERCKHELGFNLIGTAQPYIGDVVSIFEGVIQPYLQAGASTTSSTVVTAQSSATVIALTLSSITGFSAFDRVVIDVDDLQEVATVRAVSGSTIAVALRKAHGVAVSSYPVTVEGGESIVREILGYIRAVKSELSSTFGEGALQRVDEIWFYQTGGSTLFGNIGTQLTAWRNELASALGVPNMWAQRSGATGRMSVY